MIESELPRVLTIDGALRCGWSRSQIQTSLARGRWRRLAAGTLLTRPDEPTRADWAQAGIALGGQAAALSGWDVVRRHRLVGPVPPNPYVLVLTEVGQNRKVGGIHLRPSRRQLRSHVLSSRDESLPLARLAELPRAIADTALLIPHATPVRAMVTAAIQRRLCTPVALAAEFAACPRNDSGFLRKALIDVEGGARSVAEAEAVELLRRSDIPPFEVNAPIRDRAGTVVAVADVLWRHLRAVLEIDGREYHFGELEWKETMARHNLLSRLGLAVVHYPPSDIRSRRRRWADEVAAWLSARRTELGAA